MSTFLVIAGLVICLLSVVSHYNRLQSLGIKTRADSLAIFFGGVFLFFVGIALHPSEVFPRTPPNAFRVGDLVFLFGDVFILISYIAIIRFLVSPVQVQSTRDRLKVIAIKVYSVLTGVAPIFLLAVVGFANCFLVNDSDQAKWQYFVLADKLIAVLLVAGLFASIILVRRHKLALAFVCVAVPFVAFVTFLCALSFFAPPIKYCEGL